MAYLTKCNVCKREVASNANSCPHCGAPVFLPEQRTVKSNCPFCNHPLEAGAAYCPSCYRAVNQPTRPCPQCGGIIPAADKSCFRCGAPLVRKSKAGKVWAIIGICVAILILLSAITPDYDTPAKDAGSSPSALEAVDSSPSSTPAPVLDIEILSEQLVLYQDGETIKYLAEIKNTGDVPIAFSKIELDLEDSEGHLLAVADNLFTMPRVAKPGEIFYVSREVLHSYEDENIDFSQEFVGKLNYSIKQAEAVELDVELTEITFSSYYGYPHVVGRIKNNSDNDYSYIHMAVPIFSEDNVLQSVLWFYIEVGAGEVVSFDEKDLDCDPDIDYTKSRLGAPMFFKPY